jgi:trafficking protein particle complex subunit 4
MCLRCLQTRTGIKFVITAEKGTSDMDLVLREIYVLVSQRVDVYETAYSQHRVFSYLFILPLHYDVQYTESVLKDPFYELDMPIRSELFVQAVDALIDRVASKSGTRR